MRIVFFTLCIPWLVLCAQTDQPDRDSFDCFLKGMKHQLEASAMAYAKTTFPTRKEALEGLLKLTPTNFQANPSYFAECARFITAAGGPEAYAKQMADFVRTHKEYADRKQAAVWAELEPTMKLVFENFQTQFPSPFLPDPTAALRKGKETGKCTVIIFVAEWSPPCAQLDGRIEDDDWQRFLMNDVIACRVDLTNESVSDKKGPWAQFALEGVPTVIVFDPHGKEVMRTHGPYGPADLKALRNICLATK